MGIGFDPPKFWGPDWAPKRQMFSQGVVQPEGRVVHITGQVAWDENNAVVGGGDVRAQMTQCVDNLETVLAVVGGKLEDIVSLTIYFTDRDDMPGISEIRHERLTFADGKAPISIYIQIAGLVLPEFKVEIVPIAVIPHDRFIEPTA